MKILTILTGTAALAALSACAPRVQQICEDVYQDKLNPSVQVCTDVAIEYASPVYVDRGPRNDKPTPPVTPPEPPEPPEPPCSDCDPVHPPKPPKPPVDDRCKGREGRSCGDNSDANGRGGNKHYRDDFTHEGTETAEDKKDD